MKSLVVKLMHYAIHYSGCSCPVPLWCARSYLHLSGSYRSMTADWEGHSAIWTPIIIIKIAHFLWSDWWIFFCQNCLYWIYWHYVPTCFSIYLHSGYEKRIRKGTVQDWPKMLGGLVSAPFSRRSYLAKTDQGDWVVTFIVAICTSISINVRTINAAIKQSIVVTTPSFMKAKAKPVVTNSDWQNKMWGWVHFLVK